MRNDPIQTAELIEVNILADDQAEAFDTEYHSPKELAQKVAALSARFGDEPFSILDIGGGNGRFLDGLLRAFPNAIGTILDVSAPLLARNALNDRKTIVHGSVSELTKILGSNTFDAITINWVLHHLVGNSYDRSRANAVACLRICREHLNERGAILVAENMFDGYLGTNLPSRIIFAITSIQYKPFARVARRFFNTAGIGVCFQSGRSWQRIFNESRLHEAQSCMDDRMWRISASRRIQFIPLCLRGVSHRHFLLVKH